MIPWIDILPVTACNPTGRVPVKHWVQMMRPYPFHRRRTGTMDRREQSQTNAGSHSIQTKLAILRVPLWMQLSQQLLDQNPKGTRTRTKQNKTKRSVALRVVNWWQQGISGARKVYVQRSMYSRHSSIRLVPRPMKASALVKLFLRIPLLTPLTPNEPVGLWPIPWDLWGIRARVFVSMARQERVDGMQKLNKTQYSNIPDSPQDIFTGSCG